MNGDENTMEEQPVISMDEDAQNEQPVPKAAQPSEPEGRDGDDGHSGSEIYRGYTNHHDLRIAMISGELGDDRKSVIDELDHMDHDPNDKDMQITRDLFTILGYNGSEKKDVNEAINRLIENEDDKTHNVLGYYGIRRIREYDSGITDGIAEGMDETGRSQECIWAEKDFLIAAGIDYDEGLLQLRFKDDGKLAFREGVPHNPCAISNLGDMYAAGLTPIVRTDEGGKPILNEYGKYDVEYRANPEIAYRLYDAALEYADSDSERGRYSDAGRERLKANLKRKMEICNEQCGGICSEGTLEYVDDVNTGDVNTGDEEIIKQIRSSIGMPVQYDSPPVRIDLGTPFMPRRGDGTFESEWNAVDNSILGKLKEMNATTESVSGDPRVIYYFDCGLDNVSKDRRAVLTSKPFENCIYREGRAEHQKNGDGGKPPSTTEISLMKGVPSDDFNAESYDGTWFGNTFDELLHVLDTIKGRDKDAPDVGYDELKRSMINIRTNIAISILDNCYPGIFRDTELRKISIPGRFGIRFTTEDRDTGQLEANVDPADIYSVLELSYALEQYIDQIADGDNTDAKSGMIDDFINTIQDANKKTDGAVKRDLVSELNELALTGRIGRYMSDIMALGGWVGNEKEGRIMEGRGGWFTDITPQEAGYEIWVNILKSAARSGNPYAMMAYAVLQTRFISGNESGTWIKRLLPEVVVEAMADIGSKTEGYDNKVGGQGGNEQVEAMEERNDIDLSLGHTHGIDEDKSKDNIAEVSASKAFERRRNAIIGGLNRGEIKGWKLSRMKMEALADAIQKGKKDEDVIGGYRIFRKAKDIVLDDIGYWYWGMKDNKDRMSCAIEDVNQTIIDAMENKHPREIRHDTENTIKKIEDGATKMWMEHTGNARSRPELEVYKKSAQLYKMLKNEMGNPRSLNSKNGGSSYRASSPVMTSVYSHFSNQILSGGIVYPFLRDFKSTFRQICDMKIQLASGKYVPEVKWYGNLTKTMPFASDICLLTEGGNMYDGYKSDAELYDRPKGEHLRKLFGFTTMDRARMAVDCMCSGMSIIYDLLYGEDMGVGLHVICLDTEEGTRDMADQFPKIAEDVAMSGKSDRSEYMDDVISDVLFPLSRLYDRYLLVSGMYSFASSYRTSGNLGKIADYIGLIHDLASSKGGPSEALEIMFPSEDGVISPIMRMADQGDRELENLRYDIRCFLTCPKDTKNLEEMFGNVGLDLYGWGEGKKAPDVKNIFRYLALRDAWIDALGTCESALRMEVGRIYEGLRASVRTCVLKSKEELDSSEHSDYGSYADTRSGHVASRLISMIHVMRQIMGYDDFDTFTGVKSYDKRGEMVTHYDGKALMEDLMSGMDERVAQEFGINSPYSEDTLDLKDRFDRLRKTNEYYPEGIPALYKVPVRKVRSEVRVAEDVKPGDIITIISGPFSKERGKIVEMDDKNVYIALINGAAGIQIALPRDSVRRYNEGR